MALPAHSPREVSLRERDPADDRPDAELVSLARRGDRRAFGRLHERYARAVHAVLLARVPARDADDLVQDVFLSAIERLDGLRDDGAFGGWLMQVARHRAIDHLRARRDVVELPRDLAHAPRPSAEVAQVLDALRALPETYRETLIMRLVEGMTGAEIAARTGLTEGSVRVNLHRGMQLLRERLGVEVR